MSSLTNYTVEVLVSEHNLHCVCALHGTILQFLANDYVGDTLYFRVAANTDRGQSDFAPYRREYVPLGELQSCVWLKYVYSGLILY